MTDKWIEFTDQGAQFRAAPRGQFSRSLPERYFSEMGTVIDELTAGWFSEIDKSNGYEEFMKKHWLYSRMDVCHDAVLPWLRSAVPDLQQKTVLEIGCGTGSATAPLALAVENVIGVDIEQSHVDVAKKRCDVLGVNNVALHVRSSDWIDLYQENPFSLVPQSVDMIFCYALLEHLLPQERIRFLQGAWNHLDAGGLLVIVECPNRLACFDWHSSMMAFSDVLPHELAFLDYDRSPRPGIPPNIMAASIDDVDGCNRQELYRFGRGASFHEFYLALDREGFEIIAGPYSENAIDRSELPGLDPEWEKLLARKLAEMTPPIPRDFAACCLDLVIRKI